MLCLCTVVLFHQEDDDQKTDNLQNQTQEEDEKDQFSPVSVLDLPFEDDEREDGREEEVEDEDDYDLECSYALMQSMSNYSKILS